MGRWRATRAWARLGVLLAVAICITPHSISALSWSQDRPTPRLECDCTEADHAARPECNCLQSEELGKSTLHTQSFAEHSARLNEDSAEDLAEYLAEASAEHFTRSNEDWIGNPLKVLRRRLVPDWFSSRRSDDGQILQIGRPRLPFGIPKFVGQLMQQIPKQFDQRQEDKERKEHGMGEDKKNNNHKGGRETEMSDTSTPTDKTRVSKWHKIDINKYEFAQPVTNKPWKRFAAVL